MKRDTGPQGAVCTSSQVALVAERQLAGACMQMVPGRRTWEPGVYLRRTDPSSPVLLRSALKALLGRLLRPFQGTCFCCPFPLSKPIKLGTLGNYRLGEAQIRETGDMWGAGGVPVDRSCHAGLAAGKESCRHQGPYKVTRHRPFTGVLGWGMTSLAANQGFPQSSFLLWGLCLWLLRCILGKVGAFFRNAWNQWVLS